MHTRSAKAPDHCEMLIQALDSFRRADAEAFGEVIDGKPVVAEVRQSRREIGGFVLRGHKRHFCIVMASVPIGSTAFPWTLMAGSVSSTKVASQP